MIRLTLSSAFCGGLIILYLGDDIIHGLLGRLGKISCKLLIFLKSNLAFSSHFSPRLFFFFVSLQREKKSLLYRASRSIHSLLQI